MLLNQVLFFFLFPDLRKVSAPVLSDGIMTFTESRTIKLHHVRSDIGNGLATFPTPLKSLPDPFCIQWILSLMETYSKRVAFVSPFRGF